MLHWIVDNGSLCPVSNLQSMLVTFPINNDVYMCFLFYCSITAGIQYYFILVAGVQHIGWTII